MSRSYGYWLRLRYNPKGEVDTVTDTRGIPVPDIETDRITGLMNTVHRWGYSHLEIVRNEPKQPHNEMNRPRSADE